VDVWSGGFFSSDYCIIDSRFPGNKGCSC